MSLGITLEIYYENYYVEIVLHKIIIMSKRKSHLKLFESIYIIMEF